MSYTAINAHPKENEMNHLWSRSQTLTNSTIVKSPPKSTMVPVPGANQTGPTRLSQLGQHLGDFLLTDVFCPGSETELKTKWLVYCQVVPI